MSFTLFYRPPPKMTHEKSVSDWIKYRFGPRYWDHDGTIGGSWVELAELEIPYLKGLLDGCLDTDAQQDLQAMIAMIRRDGSVQVRIGE